jgi:hypothetical protein
MTKRWRQSVKKLIVNADDFGLAEDINRRHQLRRIATAF